MEEERCDVLARGRVATASFAAPLPRPRTERVSPGHLVALATTTDGGQVVLWRWYDAVVLGGQDGLVRLWEPAHGVIGAQPRGPIDRPPGTRAYASAGLPGAEWWVAGPVVVAPEDADVELDEVAQLYTAYELWGSVR